MTDTTTETTVATAAAPQAKGPAPAVMMTRNPKTGGKGVTRMSVPADQVEDFKAAGWTAEA